jgi:phage terminase small subunit
MGKEIVKDDLRKRLFAALYTGRCRMNGTEAAQQAGYTGDRNALARRASELLDDPIVQTEIRRKMDRIATGQDEVLGVLVSHMRGTMADFLSFDDANEAHQQTARIRRH